MDVAWKGAHPPPVQPTKSNGRLQGDAALPTFEPDVQCCNNQIIGVGSAEDIKQTCNQEINQWIAEGAQEDEATRLAAETAAEQAAVDAKALKSEIADIKADLAAAKAEGSGTTRRMLSGVAIVFLLALLAFIVVTLFSGSDDGTPSSSAVEHDAV